MISTLIKLALAALSIASIGYYCLCMLAARRFASTARSDSDHNHPPATVMIPLCGSDFEAYDNYASFCKQVYPQFQLLFGIQDPNDSSKEVIQKLKSDFPEKDIELVIGSKIIGENPKVNNLYNMSSRAKYDFIIIADSDIRVGPDFLSAVVSPLRNENVGLVTCFYKAGIAPNFAAKIEALGISADFAPGVLAAWFKEGVTFALGATMGLRRNSLEKIGGLRAIADYLADDFMLGNLIWKAGFEIYLLPYVVETMLSPMQLHGMLRHQIRWGRGIKACRPFGYFGLIATHGPFFSLVNVIVTQAHPISLYLLAAVFGVRVLMAIYVGVGILHDEILKSNLVLLPVRDLLGFWIWCMSLFGHTVEWRGRRYKIIGDGKIVPVD